MLIGRHPPKVTEIKSGIPSLERLSDTGLKSGVCNGNVQFSLTGYNRNLWVRMMEGKRDLGLLFNCVMTEVAGKHNLKNMS